MRIGRTLPPAASPIYPREILSGIKGLFNGHRELERFEAELKDYFGSRHCFLLSSGKAALTLILEALREIRPERDEVLIPAFTCYSVPSAIVRAGLKVKLCDTSPNSLDFNFEELSNLLSQNSVSHLPNKRNKPNEPGNPNKPMAHLLCLIPTHLFGIPSDIGKIRNLLADPDVIIVEDAAQAMGTEWKSKKLGSLGDISFFSLGRGKALSTVEGGIILTDRDDIAGKIRGRMRSIPDYGPVESVCLFFKAIALSLFLHPSLYWFPKSIPFLRLGKTIYDPHFKIRRMTAFQAGLANGWQGKLRKFKKTRENNSKHWITITDTHRIRPYPSKNGDDLDLVRFPVRVDNNSFRARILRDSDQTGLGIMPCYPDSVDGIQKLSSLFQGQYYPMAKGHAHHLITLPTHDFITHRDRKKIQELITKSVS